MKNRLLKIFCAVVALFSALTFAACGKSGGGGGSDSSVKFQPEPEDRSAYSLENLLSAASDYTLGELSDGLSDGTAVKIIASGYTVGDFFSALIDKLNGLGPTGSDFQSAFGFTRYTDGNWYSNYGDKPQAHELVTEFFNYRFDGSTELEISAGELDEYGDDLLVSLMYSDGIIDLIETFVGSSPFLNALVMKTTVSDLRDMLEGSAEQKQSAAERVFEGVSLQDALYAFDIKIMGAEDIPFADAVKTLTSGGGNTLAADLTFAALDKLTASYGALYYGGGLSVGEMLTRFKEYIAADKAEREDLFERFVSYAESVTVQDVHADFSAFLKNNPEEIMRFMTENSLDGADAQTAYDELISSVENAAASSEAGETAFSDFIAGYTLGGALDAFGVKTQETGLKTIDGFYNELLGENLAELIKGLDEAKLARLEELYRAVKISELIELKNRVVS